MWMEMIHPSSCGCPTFIFSLPLFYLDHANVSIVEDKQTYDRQIPKWSWGMPGRSLDYRVQGGCCYVEVLSFGGNQPQTVLGQNVFLLVQISIPVGMCCHRFIGERDDVIRNVVLAIQDRSTGELVRR